MNGKGNGSLKIHLKANERIFVNGAVMKVDRKVTIEFLNDVVFLLEGHILEKEQATTPLRQLYFVVQSMLIEPKTAPLGRQIYDHSHRLLLETFRDQDLLEALVEIRILIERERLFEALKRIRSLFADEERLLGLTPSEQVDDAVVA